MSFDLRQIKAFEAVARCGGFSKASREIGLTQPTLTTHVKNLEENLGVRLFDRASRSVSLTPAGVVFLDYAGRILALCEESIQAVNGFTGRIEGSLHVEASTVPGEYLLPRWLVDFHSRYPRIQVTLTVSDSSLIHERVEKAQAAIGITGSPSERPSLEDILLCSDEIVLVASRPLSMSYRKKGTLLENLSSLPLIRREHGSGTQLAVDNGLSQVGIDPGSLHWEATLGSTRAVIEGVLAGLGAAFLSRGTVGRELANGSLTELDTGGMRIQRGIYIVRNTQRTLSPAASRFIEELIRAGSQLQGVSDP